MAQARIFPEDFELVGFFEAEPSILDQGVPWSYNRLTFETVRGGVSVHAVFEPANGLFEVSLKVNDQEIASAQVQALGDVQLHQAAQREALSASFGKQHENTLWLTLKPAVCLAIEG